MYWTYVRFIPRYSSSSLAAVIPAFLVVSLLSIVTDVELAKTNNSFLIFGFFFKDTCWQFGRFFAIEVFHKDNVLFFIFENYINTCGRKILPWSLFLPIIVPKNSFIVLDLFLLGRKWLLFIEYVSREDVGGFILPKSLSSFYANLYLQKHLASILQIFESGYSNAITFTLIVFSTIFFQKFSFRLWASNYVQIKDFRPV